MIIREPDRGPWGSESSATAAVLATKENNMDLLQTAYDPGWEERKRINHVVFSLSCIAIELGKDDEEMDSAVDAGRVHTVGAALALTEMIKERLETMAKK